jgi:hypothetical protein
LIKVKYKSINRAIALNSNSQLNLEIGAGNVRRVGWITSDLRIRAQVILDARANWAKRETLNFIYTEMMIASLSPPELDIFLENCFSALKSEGVLRICTVNVKKYAEVYLSEDSQLKNKYFLEMKSRHPGNKYLFDLPDLLRYPFVTHSPGVESFSYDFDSLSKKLQIIGFSKVQNKLPGSSDYEALCNLEKRRSEVLDNLQLVIEATKL